MGFELFTYLYVQLLANSFYLTRLWPQLYSVYW